MIFEHLIRGTKLDAILSYIAGKQELYASLPQVLRFKLSVYPDLIPLSLSTIIQGLF